MSQIRKTNQQKSGKQLGCCSKNKAYYGGKVADKKSPKKRSGKY